MNGNVLFGVFLAMVLVLPRLTSSSLTSPPIPPSSRYEYKVFNIGVLLPRSANYSSNEMISATKPPPFPSPKLTEAAHNVGRLYFEKVVEKLVERKHFDREEATLTTPGKKIMLPWLNVTFGYIGTDVEIENATIAKTVFQTVFSAVPDLIGYIGFTESSATPLVVNTGVLDRPLLAFCSRTALIDDIFFFRMIPNARIYCKAIADTLYTMGSRSVILIDDANEDLYSQWQSEECKDVFASNSITLLQNLHLDKGYTTPTLASIAGAIGQSAVVFLPGSRIRPPELQDVVARLRVLGAVKSGSLWFLNDVAGNRMKSFNWTESSYRDAFSGMLFTRKGPFVFERLAPYIEGMELMLGQQTEIDVIDRYRFPFDATLVFGYALAEALWMGKPITPLDMVGHLTNYTDLLGATGRVAFLKVNNGERSFYEIDIVNVNVLDAPGLSNPTSRVARWSQDTFFHWDASDREIVLPGGQRFNVTGRHQPPASPKDGSITTNLPVTLDKWVWAPNVGLSPEIAFGYCAEVWEREIGTMEYVVVYGGANEVQKFGSVFLLDLRQGRWIESHSVDLKVVRPPSSHHSCAIVGDTLFVFGGTSSFGTFENSMWAYDLLQQEWRDIAMKNAAPTPRRGAKMIADATSISSGNLYLHGGRTMRELSDELWRFDLASLIWVLIEFNYSLPTPSPREAHAFFRHDSNFVVWGGRTSVLDYPRNGVNVEGNDMWLYDVIGSRWYEVTQTNPIPPARFAFGSGYVQSSSSFHVIFGCESTAEYEGRAFGDFWRVDLRSLNPGNLVLPAWEQLETNFTSVTGEEDPGVKLEVTRRFDMLLVEWDVHFVMFAGRLGQVDTVRSVTDLWSINTLGVDLLGGNTAPGDFGAFNRIHGDFLSPDSMAYHSLFPFGEWAYVFGGITPTQEPSHHLYSFNGRSHKWTKIVPKSDEPPARYGQCGVTLGGRFYVFGGVGASDQRLHDFWVCFDSIFLLTCSQVFFPVSRTWEEPILAKDSFSMKPTSMAACVGIANDKKMLVIGGYVTASGELDSVETYYTFEVDAKKWVEHTIENPDDGPGALVFCNALTVPGQEDRVYLEGCSSGSSPLPEIWVLNITSHRWLKQEKIPVPAVFRFVSAHACAIDSGIDRLITIRSLSVALDSRTWEVRIHFLLFLNESRDAGRVYNNLVTNAHVVFDVSTKTFAYLPRKTHQTPAPREGHACMVFRDQMICIGGVLGSSVGADFGTYGLGTKSPVDVVGDSWIYNFEDVCRTTTGGSCHRCAPGSMEKDGICQICPAGTYSDSYNAKKCDYCPPGYFGDRPNSQSLSMCLPCKAGTYNPSEDVNDCLPCPPGKFCPIGAANPYDNPFKPTKPILVQPEYYSKDSTTNSIIMGVTFGVSLLVVVVVVVILLILWARRCLKIRGFIQLDFLYGAKHGVIPNPKGSAYPAQMVKKKTVLGGIFSLVAIAIVLATFFSNSLIFLLGTDDDLTRSLVPNLLQTGEVEVALNINVTLYDYLAECSGPVASSCAAGIDVWAEGFSDASLLKTTQVCRRNASTCEIMWSCPNCAHLNKKESMVHVDVRTADSFTSKFKYGLNVTSGYGDKQLSAVSGEVIADPDKIFRGLVPTSEAGILLVKTYYSETLSFSNSEDYGFHVDSLNQVEGKQVPIHEFHNENGFSFDFKLDLAEYTLEIVRGNKLTLFTFLPGILGSSVGLIGLVGIVMMITEIFWTKIFKLPNDVETWPEWKERRRQKKEARRQKKTGVQKDGGTELDDVRGESVPTEEDGDDAAKGGDGDGDGDDAAKTQVVVKPGEVKVVVKGEPDWD